MNMLYSDSKKRQTAFFKYLEYLVQSLYYEPEFADSEYQSYHMFRTACVSWFLIGRMKPSVNFIEVPKGRFEPVPSRGRRIVRQSLTAMHLVNNENRFVFKGYLYSNLLHAIYIAGVRPFILDPRIKTRAFDYSCTSIPRLRADG